MTDRAKLYNMLIYYFENYESLSEKQENEILYQLTQVSPDPEVLLYMSDIDMTEDDAKKIVEKVFSYSVIQL